MPVRFFLFALVAAAFLGISTLAHAAAKPVLVAATGHTSSVHSVTYSPDSKQIVTGSNDNTAIVWDAATGEKLRTLQGHAARVRSVTYSPDGKRIVTGSYDRMAIVWDAATGEKLRTLQGHTDAVSSVTYSPDGKRIVTGSWDKTAVIWDAATADKLRTLQGHTDRVNSVTYSPDGKRIVTGSGDKTAIVWDAATGAKLRMLQGHSSSVNSVTYSPDGTRIVTGSGDKTAIVWDAATADKLRTLQGHTDRVNSVTYSPDGKRIVTGSGDSFVTGSRDFTAVVWEATSGEKLHTLKGHSLRIESVTYSPDGKHIVTGSEDKTAIVWDAATGEKLRTLQGHADAVTCVTYGPDGKRIVTGSEDGRAIVWDLATGDWRRTSRAHPSFVTAVTYSPDGKRIVTGFLGQRAIVWDAATGEKLRTLQGHTDAVTSVTYSPDGKRIVTGSEDKTAIVWDAATGKNLRTLHGHFDTVKSVVYSPDGKRIVTGSYDKTAIVWDAATGDKLRTLQGHAEFVISVAFSPDGKRIVMGCFNNTAIVWDATTGDKFRTLQGHASSVHSVTYSPDGKRIVTGSWDNTAIIWDAATGEKLRALQGHTGLVHSLTYSPDGKWIITASQDGSTRQWDAETGKEQCQMLSFADGTWAVIDPAGRFDASNGGDVKGLHWVVGQEPIALTQLKERYYDPGLLAKHFGFSKEPLREVASFTHVELYPEVAVAQADLKKPRLDVTLTNRGGGIGRVVVLVNGKEFTADARPRDADPNADKIAVQLDLSNDPRLVPGKKNKIEVFAYNGEGYLSSRGLVREFDAPGAMATDRPALHAIVVGVSKYRGDKLNLRYAAKDAEDFASALRLAAGRLFGIDKVNLTLLTAVEAEQRPSRANLVKALEALKATKPGDIVVVYLAGHGVTQSGQDGDWHYLTADAQSAELTDPEVRKQVSLSSAELTELLKAVPAQKQVLILDTCHSGRVVEKLTEKRDVPGSQIRALERIKDRTGMHVLAGCAADSVSYEASRYGQGLLTYSLLLGMRGAKLREGEYVDIVDLFGFAADKVPELARDIGGVQRPTIASPRGTSFDIGRLNAADRAKVPLQAVKPVLLRSVFQLEKPARDSLGLSKLVNERLREASAVARGAKLVFVDAEDFPGGVQPSGRYRIDGDKASVSVSLFAGEQELAAFTVEGLAGKPDELAGKIAAEVEKRLGASGGK